MSESTALAPIEHDTEIQPAPTLVLPIATPQQAREAMRQYQATKEAILDATDYQSTGPHQKFVKKSGWAKLAIAFGVSSEIMPGYPKDSRDEDGRLLWSEVKVRAVAPNGRYAEGLGRCSSTEPRFRKASEKVEHDVPATAETRGRNRAYSNLFGHGEVSWEEMTADDAGPEASAPYRTDVPKASPYKPASANRLATIAKLSRVLGAPEEPSEDMTSAEASQRITDLSREYNERKANSEAARRQGTKQPSAAHTGASAQEEEVF